METEINSYADLKAALNKLDDKQLAQRAQFMCPGLNGDHPIPLGGALAFGTCEVFCSDVNGVECQKTRSSVDNQHYPDHLVLLVDVNSYAEDWAMAYDLFTGESIYPMMKKAVQDDANGTTEL